MAKKIIFQLLKTLLNSFIAGLILGLAGLGFVVTGSTVIGTLFLGLGFLICLLYGYDVFMLKAPYMLENKGMAAVETLISIVGNVVGTIIIALIARFTGIYDTYALTVGEIIKQTNNYNYLENLLYAVFAGIIVYFGVNTYKKAEQPIARFLVLLLCGVLAFYVGNSMFSYSTFFLYAGKVDGVTFATLTSKLSTILIGNAFGAIAVPLLIKVRRKL